MSTFYLCTLGVRILDGPVTDSLEAQALLFQNQLIDVFSASWGPRDDGKTMEGPHPHCAAALEQGTREVIPFSLNSDIEDIMSQVQNTPILIFQCILKFEPVQR